MSFSSSKPEVWMRGPVADVPDLLQPVAHALLQAREEVNALMENFPEDQLWLRPAGVASPGFHLQHLSGILDRLFTYARGEQLTETQLHALNQEGQPRNNESGINESGNNVSGNMANMINRFNLQVDQAITQLKATLPESLTQFRGVGRKQLPSTTLGLLFHAAEHTQRHVGQLLVTVTVLREAK